MMCVKAHQQDLRRKVVRHALQQRAQASLPRRQGPWWRVLSHALIGYGVRLRPLWRPQPLQQTDEAEAL